MLTALVLLSLVVAARADTCYQNIFGNVYCSSLSTGARIGIGIGVAVGVIAIVALALFCFRRRRLQRNTYPVASAQYQNQGQPTYYGNQPQYPPQQPQYAAYGQQQQYGYQGNNQYATQPSYAPPQYPPPTEKVV